MMQRQRRHHALHRVGRLVAFELDPVVAGSLRRLGVDPDRVVAAGPQRRDKATQRAATNLQHRRRGQGELVADERPHRGQPGVI